jgi:hypothetical protein
LDKPGGKTPAPPSDSPVASVGACANYLIDNRWRSSTVRDACSE